MIFWWKLTPFLCAIALFAAAETRAQTASAARTAPDPTGVRAGLATEEQAHRTAYQAAHYTDAIAAARRGLALAERAGTLPDQVQFMRHLAYDHWLVGDAESALEYSQRLLEAADQLDDNRVRSQSHRYLSQIYGTLDDDLRAREHADQAQQFAEAAQDADLRIYALTEVGLSEARRGHYDAAVRCFTESQAYWEKQSRPWNAINSLVNLADVTEARGDFARALRDYEKIAAARVATKDLSGQARAVTAIARLLCQLHRPDAALARLAPVRALADTIGSHRLFVEFYTSLAQAQEARHDFPAALASERLAADARELLVGERARLRADELEARLELAQKQQAIDQLRTTVAVNEARLRTAGADLAQARSYRIVVIDGVAAIGAIAIAAGLVLRYRSRTQRLQAAVDDAQRERALLERHPPGAAGPCAT